MVWRNNPFALGILFCATCLLEPILQVTPSIAQDTVIIGNVPDQSVEINFETLNQITNPVIIPDLFLRSGRLKYKRPLGRSQDEAKNISIKNNGIKSGHISPQQPVIEPAPVVSVGQRANLKTIVRLQPKSIKQSLKTTPVTKSGNVKISPSLVYKKEDSVVSKAVPNKELTEVNRNSNKILISFNPEDKELQEKEILKLNKIIRIMKLNKNQRLELTAYSSDNSASKARRMSLMRALSIRSFLIKRGVGSNKLNVKALGNNTSMGPVDRVDIILLN